MSMLLFVTHRLWSIFGDSGSVVSSVVSSDPALLSFHMLTGNLDRARGHVGRSLVRWVGEGRHLLGLLPPFGAQGGTGMALLVIRGADCDLIPFLLQSSYVFPIRLGLDARRRRARLEGVCHECKAVVQECADLWIVCSD